MSRSRSGTAQPIACRVHIVATLVALCALAAAPAAYAAFPGDNGKIAYASITGCGIWTVQPDGSGATRLGNTGCPDEYPDWSADGKKVTYNNASTQQSWIIDGHGQSNATFLTAGRHPSYSPVLPDGTRKIVFNDATGYRELYTINEDGTGLNQLTGYATQKGPPDWSPVLPDGSTKIAYSQSAQNGFPGGIWLFDYNTATRYQVADTGEEPDWSPDGSKIVYRGAGTDIWTMHADGSNKVQVPNADGWAPVWSPDGQKIAYAQDQGFGPPGSPCEEQVVFQIYTIRPDGTDKTPVTTYQCAYDIDPDWQPITGRIVVRKISNPDDPQDFTFSAGGFNPASFLLDDDPSDSGLRDTRILDVKPGTYSVSESVPAGWDQTSARCDDGSPVSSISVSADETVTCTFLNTKRGRIVAVKNAVPDDPQDFSFTAGGGLSPASFSLDDDSDGTLQNTRTFNDVTPGSGYSLAEANPGASGWYIAGSTCDDGSPVSNISVAAGETVTCTFTNARNYPRPGGGTPLRVPLVPAFAPCTSPNATHVAPINNPSCTPPQLQSGRLAVGFLGQGTGYLRLDAVLGNPNTPADEADVNIQGSIADVRCATGLTFGCEGGVGSDYTGSLLLRLDMRQTDRANGGTGNESATALDFTLGASFGCTATGGSQGSSCAFSTSFDALSPGLAKEGKRAVSSALAATVYDPGFDGSIGGGCPFSCGTGDETAFVRQGLFTP